jgi:tRNA (guanine-N7-)-methyltransferase
MRTYHLERFDPEHFQPTDQAGEIAVEFKEFLYDPGRRKGMARVVITEESQVQHLWIEIAWAKGRWHIRPARGCEIVPTVGLQRALDLIHDAAQRSVEGDDPE